MSNWPNTRTVEFRETTLSLAVGLVDVYTEGLPGEEPTVSLANRDVEPVRNPSGYHLFLDLDADRVTVEVDGGDPYFDERREVVLGEGDPDGDATVVDDPATPLVIELTPTPAYEFPATTTLVTGHVEDADGNPVEGATVSLETFAPSVRTTAEGEYALWVPASPRDVLREGDDLLVSVNGVDADGPGGNGGTDGSAIGTRTDPTIEVDHPSLGHAAEQLTVSAGDRTVHHITIG